MDFLKDFLPLYIFVIVVVAVKLFFIYNEKQRLMKIAIESFNNLTGLEFEKYLQMIFTEKEFKVSRTEYKGDNGVNLIIEKDNFKTAVQAKRSKNRLGVKGIQEIKAGQANCHCDSAMVITNNYFTAQAKKLAEINMIELWDKKRLIKETLNMPVNRNILTSNS